jgi:uncharacterized protein (TIGR03000 family)
MYGMVLAAFLGTGAAAPAGDIHDEVRDLKRAVDALRKEQAEARVDELKMIIAGLRTRLVEQKLDELRRDVLELKYEELHLAHPGHPWRFLPVPAMPRLGAAGRALIHADVPADAVLYANDQEVSAGTPVASFVTPELEPGKEYYYDFKAVTTRDGKAVTRVKRVTVRPGQVVRLDYAEMDPR